MTTLSQRVFFSDNGTLSDLSLELGDFRTGSSTLALVAADDALYIGCEYPFNHRHFDVSSANAALSTVTVSIWNGTSWDAAVDVLDYTKSGGATLAQDGFIAWTTNKDKTWSPEEDSSDVTGLTGTDVYNLYWVKLTFSNNLTGSTALSYVGHKFSTDAQLYGFYPDLNSSDLKTAFAAGKTDWNEQHYQASDALVRELKRKGIIFSGTQVFDYAVLNEPAIHKTAEIIYGGMGKAYAENAVAAGARYSKALDLGYFRVDHNSDGHLTEKEKRETVGYLRR